MLSDPPSIHVISCPHPFTTQRDLCELPTGGTLADILALVNCDPLTCTYAHVFVDDCLIPSSAWARVKPKPGRIVTIRIIPHGGGGGGGGKNPLRTVLSIAIVAATMVFAAPLGAALGLSSAPIIAGSTASLASLVGGAIITVAGTLALNALAPPPKSSGTALARGGLDSVSPTLSITGSSNQVDPYGPIPRVYGRHRLFPKKAARDYTEVAGGAQYLRCLFDFGYGPLDLSDLRIGTIPLEQFDGVEIEIRQGFDYDAPITLYSDTIREDSYSLKVTAAGGSQIVETRDQTDEITVDLSWDGLVHWDGNANRQNQSVTVRIEWRAVGATPWTLHAEETVTAATEAGVRRDWRIVPGQPGRYQVSVTRLTADNTRTDVRDTCYLTAVRSIQYTYPVRRPGRCLVALRIKATDQLNGAVDHFSAVAQARLKVWDGSRWVVQATRNPAWAFVDVLTGSANRRPVALSRLDLPSLKDWADACDQLQDDGSPRWTLDTVVDYASTVFDTLRDIAASARAAVSLRDGRFSIVRDHPQTVPVQLFTPRNSWGFRSSIAFVDLPHALRVRYVEPTRDWSQQEVTVYADGYTEATATRFETLETFGCTSRAQAWREGRYHMAVATLRPASYEFQADIEHLVCGRGDLIRVSHDVPLWGGGWGRITSLSTDTQGRTIACELDDAVSMEAGKSYVLRVRSRDGVGAAQPVLAAPGETKALTFATPVTQALALGDLAVFGESERESALLLVKAIYPGPDLSARIVCVDAAPAVHQAETGEIPAYDPGTSWGPVGQKYAPPPPSISDVRSDETVLVRANGVLQPRIVVRFTQGGGGPVDAVQIQYRRSLSGEDWWPVPSVSPSAGVVSIAPVEEGTLYDIRLRAVTRIGLASDWATVWYHRVVGRTTRPPVISGFVADVTPDGVRLRWDALSIIDFDTYEVRTGGWDGGSILARLAATDISLGPMPAGSHLWSIKALDVLGLTSPTAAQATATITPPGLPSITAQVIDNFVTLSYPTTPGSHLIQHYELRRGPYLASATSLGHTDSAFSPIFEPGSGTYSYWVRAVDIASNPGPWSKVTATVAQPTDYVLLVDWASSLGGAKTNAVTENGKLLVPVDTEETWEQHFVSRGWITPQDQIGAGYEIYAQPTPGVGRYVEVFDYGTMIHNVLVTVALGKISIAGSVDVQPLIEISVDGVDWTAVATGWQAAVAALRYLRVSLTISGADATALAALSLAVSIDIKLKDDGGTGVANAADAGGTFVSFNRAFIDVASISVTPKATAPVFAVYDFLDVPDPTGFKVLLFNGSGVRVSGEFSWTVRGY